MTPGRLARQTLHLPLFFMILLLLGGMAGTLAQDDDSAGKDADKKEQAAPAGEKEQPAADDKDGETGKEGTEAKKATAKAKEEGDLQISSEGAARMLREPGDLVSQTGDLPVAVIPDYYAEFPGFDLDHLTEEQREKLLEEANSKYCTCGCRGDTVARCVVLDPSCEVARQMMQTILDKVTATGAETSSAQEE